MVKTLNQKQVDASVAVARTPRKVSWFNTVLGETAIFCDLSNPIHETQPPVVRLNNGIDEEEPHISITVGSAIIHLRCDSGERGNFFYLTTPLDDFYINLVGLSTTQRGPLFDIGHVFMNRGSAWGVKHKDANLGYALYLGYQLSYELKRGNNHRAREVA